MKTNFKEISVEVHDDNLGKYNVRMDNVCNQQYINLLTTTDRDVAAAMYASLCAVMAEFAEGGG